MYHTPPAERKRREQQNLPPSNLAAEPAAAEGTYEVDKMTPAGTYKDRTTEAKHWHYKAVQKIHISKNMRRDVKDTCLEALSRVMRLLKDGEDGIPYGDAESQKKWKNEKERKKREETEETIKKTREEMEGVLKEREEQIERVREETERLIKELAEKEEGQREAKERAERAEGEREGMEREKKKIMEEAEEKLRRKEAEIEILRKESIRNDELLHKMNRTRKEQREETERKVNEAKEKLMDKIDERLREIKEMKTTIEEKDQEIEELKEIEFYGKATAWEGRIMREILDEKMEELEEWERNWKEREENLEVERGENDEQLTKLAREADELEGKLEELRKENSELKNRLQGQKVEVENPSPKKGNKKDQEESKVMKDCIEALKENKEGMESIMKECMEMIRKNTEERGAMSAETMNELKKCKEKLEKAGQEIEELKGTVENQKIEIEKGKIIKEEYEKNKKREEGCKTMLNDNKAEWIKVKNAMMKENKQLKDTMEKQKVALEQKVCGREECEKIGKAVEECKGIMIEHGKALEKIEELQKETQKLRQIVEGQKVMLERGGNGRDECEMSGKVMEECKELMKGNREDIGKLREVVEKATYAKVTARPVTGRPEKGTRHHSIVVTSKDVGDTGEMVMEKIKKAANAKKEGLQIENIRKAKDKKVIIGCKTREELNRVRERIEKGKELKVEEMKNKDPQVILRDVPTSLKDEDLLGGLRIQNGGVFEGVSNEDNRMVVKYRRKARNPQNEHVVLTVSPCIWSRMTEAGALHIDVHKVRVSDQSPLIQCSRCLGYGHGKRFCKETVDVCSYCGGPHLRMRCEARKSGQAPECINCRVAELDQLDHEAFSNECPVRNRWDTLARSTVQYS